MFHHIHRPFQSFDSGINGESKDPNYFISFANHVLSIKTIWGTVNCSNLEHRSMESKSSIASTKPRSIFVAKYLPRAQSRGIFELPFDSGVCNTLRFPASDANHMSRQQPQVICRNTTFQGTTLSVLKHLKFSVHNTSHSQISPPPTPQAALPPSHTILSFPR